MSRGKSKLAGSILPAIIALGVFTYPLVGLAIGLLTSKLEEPIANPLSGRLLEILLRSVSMSSAAAVTSILFAFPAVMAMSHLSRNLPRSILMIAMLATILSPPMVYAFGWNRILPLSLQPQIRCVFVWTLWTWPIPAWFVGTSLARINRQSREAAMLDISGKSLLLRITIPQLVPTLVLCLLILFTIFLGDYGTPHAFGLQVISTELMANAQSCNTPTNVTISSIPCVAIILIALFALGRMWTSNTFAHDNDAPTHERTSMMGAGIFGGGYFVICWLIPVGKLVTKITWSDMIQSWTIYGGDLIATLLVAGVAAIVSVLLGLLLIRQPRFAIATMIVAIIWGAVPGALVGEALISSFNRPVVGYIYDRWPILTLSYLLHFGWIGIAAVLLAKRTLAHEIEDQASIEGASEIQYIMRLFLPNTWPTIAVGAGAMIILSIADLAASTLVRVPSYNPIAHVIIEKFHRLEDGMMIALCLNLIGVVVVVTGITSWALGVRRRL